MTTANHDLMVDKVRFDTTKLLRRCLSVEDELMVIVGDSGLFSSGQRPDVWFMYAGETVVIEVGKVKATKWLDQYPMIHVDYSHRVGIIGEKGSWFEQLILECLVEVFQDRKVSSSELPGVFKVIKAQFESEALEKYPNSAPLRATYMRGVEASRKGENDQKNPNAMKWPRTGFVAAHYNAWYEGWKSWIRSSK